MNTLKWLGYMNMIIVFLSTFLFGRILAYIIPNDFFWFAICNILIVPIVLVIAFIISDIEVKYYDQA